MNDRELGQIGTLGIAMILSAFLLVLLMDGCATAPPPANVIERVRFVTDWDKCSVVCAPYETLFAVRTAEDEGFCRCKDGAKARWETEKVGGP